MTVATEAWPPNVPIAAARLRPLGIPLVQDECAPDNIGQDNTERGRLPFRDGAFALVANRHEAFLAAEVNRVLSPGGVFITQQTDFHSYDDLPLARTGGSLTSLTAGFRLPGSRWTTPA
jgi:hypothetical protein